MLFTLAAVVSLSLILETTSLILLHTFGGIMTRHEQSKGNEDGVEVKSNTPISNWAEILMTGELKSNPIQDGQRPAWLDLATYAWEVFRAQDRRFVLGFTLCGSIMRL